MASASAQTAANSWEGPYNPIPQHPTSDHCCEIAHAILLANGPGRGKVLLIQSTGERWLWDPAAPNSVSSEALCDFPPPPFEHNQFCAGHSADADGNIVVLGGTRRASLTLPTCGPKPTWSYVFDPVAMCWSSNYPLLVPSPTPTNFGCTRPRSACTTVV